MSSGEDHLPRVSVLMPVHDAAPYLDEAVRSVLEQDAVELELVAVDDGSRDRSAELLDAWAARDPRVRVFHQENRGIVATLNRAAELARGELLARMDADDTCLPGRLAAQVAFLDARPECVAVGTRVRMVDPVGAPIRDFACEQTHEAIDAEHLAGRGGAIVHPAVMMRAEALAAVGSYRPECQFAEDLDLFLRLAEWGRLANLPDLGLLYRQHLGSIGATRRALQLEASRRAVDDARRRRGLPPARLPEPALARSRRAMFSKWAWWALAAGHVATARKYAFAVLRRRPWSPAAWRLAYCAVRGH